MKALLAIVTIILSGCVAPSLENQEPTLVSSLEIPAAPCLGVFALRAPEFSEIDSWLPPGFTAGDASAVFSDALVPIPTVNRGLMGAFATSCGNESFKSLNFWIFIEPPTVAGFENNPDALNWFDVAGFYQNYPGFETMQSWNMSMEVAEMEVTDASTAAFAGRQFLVNQEDLVFNAINFAAAPIMSLDGPIVTWQTNPNGTLAFEANLVAEANSGFGSCQSDYAWIRDFMMSCDEENLLMYGTIDDLTAGGTFRYFDGILPK